MSCQIRLIANISDVESVRRCLFPTDDQRGSDKWLQQCLISVSPIGDLIAIANDRRIVILSAKDDLSSSITEYIITYSGSIHDNDNIKAVLCLPVVSENKSSLYYIPDFTCILIGFESGYVRFYTDNCELLMEERLHNETISSIKCQSQHSPRPDLSPTLHTEEIYVQYQSNLCVITGNQLFPILRNCYSEYIELITKGGATYEINTTINCSLKKWGFSDQAIINDVIVVGINLHSTFDHLMTATICGGFDAKYRSTSPCNNLVLAVGSRPFIGFHYALEGCTQPVLSDVAKAMANKLKSALPNWIIGKNNQNEQKLTSAQQSIDQMGCRFGLYDLNRTGQRIILTWDHRFAVISDSLGRVILIDAYRGILLKIFKGYRDAQCSFVHVADESLKKHRIGNKIALFLIIYSPKKGTIEFFTLVDGVKIATFTASKYSILIYLNYGLMGIPSTSKSKYCCQFNTLFIDNNGQIKDFIIPFHFALPEENNKTSRDIHLFKKIKQILKYNDKNDLSEIFNISKELQTIQFKIQTIELFLSDGNISPNELLNCCRYFLDQYEENEGLNDTTLDIFKLKLLLVNSIALLDFFIFLMNDESSGEDDDDDDDDDNLIMLNFDEKDLQNLKKILEINTNNDYLKSTEVKVTFFKNNLNFSQFITIFNLNNNNNIININKNSDDLLIYQVSEFIFNKYIYGKRKNFKILQNKLISSCISLIDLFYLLLKYWIERSLININFEYEMTNLFNIIMNLIESSDNTEFDLIVNYNETSNFWNKIREQLVASNRPFPALIIAIICKLVLFKIEQKDTDNDEIEILSQENVEWSILIGKLEDITLLNLTLTNKAEINNYDVLPKLTNDIVNISLRLILVKGKGAVSELVAQWLTTSGIQPDLLVINDVIYKKEKEINNSSSDSDTDDDLPPKQDISIDKINIIKNEQIFKYLNLIRDQFPYSLESSMLLTNMCWEYALAWQKSIHDLTLLDACQQCLNNIPNCYVKIGLYNLVWNTHLKIMFESTCKLINKVGKLPKERLCKLDTGLADYQIEKFLKIITEYFDNYMNAIQKSSDKPKQSPNYEQIWDNGPESLVELALDQDNINYSLLHLHYQLSIVLLLMTTYSVKLTKPLNNLFEPYMMNLFFIDFHTKTQINFDYSDAKIQIARMQFLYKIISASLENINIIIENEQQRQVFVDDHLNCMSKCVKIARLWNLDVDTIRRYQVVQIYKHNCDSFGNEALSFVNNRQKLGIDLLSIAGKRLSHFLKTSTDLCKNVVAFTPAVTRYIEQLDDQWCAPSNLKDIEGLVTQSLTCMDPFDKYEIKIAELFLDGLETLNALLLKK